MAALALLARKFFVPRRRDLGLSNQGESGLPRFLFKYRTNHLTPKEVNLTREEGKMKRKRILLLAAMALVLSVASFLVAPPVLFTQGRRSVKKEAKFTKVANKKWRVDPVHASQNDEVAWSDSTSDLYFQFMNATLFGVETQTLKKGNTLTLTVQTAVNGAYHYAIFRTADSTYVIGNSPPTIIIP